MNIIVERTREKYEQANLVLFKGLVDILRRLIIPESGSHVGPFGFGMSHYHWKVHWKWSHCDVGFAWKAQSELGLPDQRFGCGSTSVCGIGPPSAG